MDPNAAPPLMPEQPEILTSPQPRKSHALVMGLAGVVLLGLGLLGGFMFANKTPYQAPTQTSYVSPTSTQSFPTANPLSELNGFPIYPEAVFVKKEVHEPCPTGTVAGGPIICDTTGYEFSVKDKALAVFAWYQNTPHTGWSCKGGSGGDTVHIITGCSTGTTRYALSIDEELNGAKTISIFVPTNAIGTTDTSSWKTYISPDNKYTFKYPLTPGWESNPVDTPDGMGNSARVFCNVRAQPVECKKYTVHDFEVSPNIYKSLDEYITKVSGISDIQRVSLDGEPAIKAAYAGSAQAGGSAINYFVVHNGKGYQISYWFDLLGLNKLSQFPNPTPDIISTFKFIN